MIQALNHIIRVCENQLPCVKYHKRRSIVVERADSGLGEGYAVSCYINHTLIYKAHYFKLWEAIAYGEEFLHKASWWDIFVAGPQVTRFGRF